MALFRRAAGASLHPALGSDLAAAALPAAARGDVHTVQAAYESAALPDHTLVLQVLAEAVPRARAAAWVAEEPANPVAWAFHGAATAAWAAEVRGGALPAQTPAGQLLDHEQGMADARRALLRSVELGDRDPGPWAPLLMTDYAGGGHDLLSDLAELRRRSPFDVEGMRIALDQLGERWYGGPGEARALAEDVHERAPQGSEAHVMMFLVVRQEWFYLARFLQDRKGALAHITSPQTRASLEEALDRSLRSPQHRPQQTTALVRNHVAHVWSIAGNRAGVREQQAALHGTVTRWPWELYGDPVDRYTAAAR